MEKSDLSRRLITKVRCNINDIYDVASRPIMNPPHPKWQGFERQKSLSLNQLIQKKNAFLNDIIQFQRQLEQEKLTTNNNKKQQSAKNEQKIKQLTQKESRLKRKIKRLKTKNQKRKEHIAYIHHLIQGSSTRLRQYCPQLLGSFQKVEGEKRDMDQESIHNDSDE